MAKDKFHELVREALQNEGWTITDDPFTLRLADKKMVADLGAERLIAAERDMERIVVEVKSFLSPSAFYELHEAVGQFGNYRRILKLAEENRTLFLAMPEDVFNILFNDAFGSLTIQEEHLRFILFQPDTKNIIRWIK